MDKNLMAYADDTVSKLSGKSWTEVATTMSHKLDLIYSWLHQNKLILNTDKTVFMTFGNYKDPVLLKLEINMNGKNLKTVENSKYLGLIYDFNIKWDIHVNNIIKKTKYLVYSLL